MTTTGSFATLLRRHRVAAGLSQEALAERAGLGARAVAELERAKRRKPHRATIESLAEALELASEERAALEMAILHSPQAVPDVER
jgi:transcriptional regulator with XRE-family HTH domain